MRRRAMMGAAAAGLAGVVAGGTPAGASGRFSLDRLRLVSLSHVNDPATTRIFPGDPDFFLDTIATIAKDGYYLQYVREGEHTGTHWVRPAISTPANHWPTTWTWRTCSGRL